LFRGEVNDGELFAFAGLWDRWRDPTGQWISSCSILTTTLNAITVHDRMPSDELIDLWLDPGMTNVDALSELPRPFDARLMRAYPVSNRVNQVQNVDMVYVEPVGLDSLRSASCLPSSQPGRWQCPQRGCGCDFSFMNPRFLLPT